MLRTLNVTRVKGWEMIAPTGRWEYIVRTKTDDGFGYWHCESEGRGEGGGRFV